VTTVPARPPQTLSERIARLDPEVVTPIGKVVLLTIAAFADRYTGENAWVSESTVRDLSGFGRTAIVDAYRHLHKIGALAYATGGTRPRGCDPRVRQRSIVIEHLTAKAPRRCRQATQSTPTTVPPNGNEPCRQAVTTFPVSLSKRERHTGPRACGQALAPDSPLQGGDPIAGTGEGDDKPQASPWRRLESLLSEFDLSPASRSTQALLAWRDVTRDRRVGEIRDALRRARKRMPVTLATCSARDLEAELAGASV
jgi:hypothetical protein